MKRNFNFSGSNVKIEKVGGMEKGRDARLELVQTAEKGCLKLLSLFKMWLSPATSATMSVGITTARDLAPRRNTSRN